MAFRKGPMQNATINFALGLSVGFVLFFLMATDFSDPNRLYFRVNPKLAVGEIQHAPGLTREDIDKMRPEHFQNAHVHHDVSKIADELKQRIRVLCWVMTSQQNIARKAIHVRNTWAHRCNKLLFITSENNTTFPTVRLDIPGGRDHLTAKTMKAFRYVYDNHFNDADWFMKADDDTYVILENLRYFLSSHNTEDPIYFGHHFKKVVKQGYLSGGAGYVLSKEALRRFGERGNSSVCRQDGGAEDAEFGICMKNLGVKVGNSTDRYGRSRFHCFAAETHIMGKYPDWYYTYDANGANKGAKNMSDYAISFHYVPPTGMYSLEYFTYHLKPYGIIPGNQDLNQPAA